MADGLFVSFEFGVSESLLNESTQRKARRANCVS